MNRKAPIPPRSLILKLAALAIAAVIGGGCGAATGASTAAKSAASGAGSTTSEPAPDVQSGSLVSPFTYDSGTVAFDAPPASFSPSVTASDAVKSFLATGVFSGIEDEGTPEVFLAAYSSWGKTESATDIPVWVVRYTDIPDSPSGGGAGVMDGGAASTNPNIVLHDVVAIVDASTGKCLAAISSLPDATPQPPPPDVAPGADGSKTRVVQDNTP